MLHSGSRNIGKMLADIGRARKLAHNAKLPDRDLAVFLAGTPEMEGCYSGRSPAMQRSARHAVEAPEA